MKAVRRVRTRSDSELATARARLADSEEALRAIRAGEVDSVVVAGGNGRQVFTLQGEGHAYRVLIESMNEGAVTLTADAVILYANACFARMVGGALETVIGSSFDRLLSAADQASLRPKLRRTPRSGAKLRMMLDVADGSRLPVQISIRSLGKRRSGEATVGIVVTDMTESRRKEETLRDLTRRVVQAQEAERARVAMELHEHITQMLCAVLIRSQALADSVSDGDGPTKRLATKLRVELGDVADEVERIARDLRPSALDHLGVAAVVRSASKAFAEVTGVPVHVTCADLRARLSADAELALYRILQEALRNVAAHAGAHDVSVALTTVAPKAVAPKSDAAKAAPPRLAFVQLSITDDGVGFDPKHRSARGAATADLGLLSMSERVTSVGGTLYVRSAPGRGTTVRVRVPLN
ncbi:MAG: PAS domain S-box protein [Planctomycetes bacterium]|nr:PAS domain S-box protein [Planctomycetota bacterium]